MWAENEVSNIFKVIILFDSLPHTCTSHGNRFKVKTSIYYFVYSYQRNISACYA